MVKAITHMHIVYCKCNLQSLHILQLKNVCMFPCTITVGNHENKTFKFKLIVRLNKIQANKLLTL